MVINIYLNTERQTSHNQRRTVMPNKRIPPSQKISNEIQELKEKFEKDETVDSKGFLDKLLKLGIRKVIQEMLEEEVKDYIGRDYYEHSQIDNGYRNGYKAGRIKTAEGKINIEKAQVCETGGSFRSKIWPHINGRTEELERMAVEMYVRGCSVRDIENLLKDETGSILLSKTAISHLNQRLWDEYEAFLRQDLSEFEIVYIFCDAVYESMRLYKGNKEGILIVWGIVADGNKVLLSLALGNKESHECWMGIFRDLKNRRLNEPVLGTTDGAPGLMKAFEESFPQSLRQRCLVHKKQNILAKVPDKAQVEVKLYLNNVYHAPDQKEALVQVETFKNRFFQIYPSAVRCFEEDFQACIQHLKCPARHRKHIYSNNMIERSFLEEKRRSKIIPRFFDEKSCLSLAFGTLIRAQETWRKIPMSFEEQVQLMELRQKLGQKSKHQEPKIDNPGLPKNKIFQKK